MLWAVTVLLTVLEASASDLRLAKIFSDGAVLQNEHPTVFGFAKSGAHLTLVANDTRETLTTTAGPDGKFLFEMAPRKPSFVGTSITVSDQEGTVSLSDVVFGDVIVCSGQSNMEFSVAEMFEANQTIRHAGAQNLRLFAVEKNASNTALDDLVDRQYEGGWVDAAPETICGSEYDGRAGYCVPHCGPSAAVKSFHRPTWGYFSAVCYVHGAAVAKAKPDRPIGLLETCWGGTSIERWSSRDALKTCDAKTKAQNGTLWNAMVVPLLDFPIKAMVWYQGEANSHTPNPYACALTAMIEDWRAKWRASSNLAVGVVQLAPAGDSSGGALRLAQTVAATLPHAGYSVSIDLHDPTSPCGSVHIRNKTAVGERLARVTLAMAYGEKTTWQGPTPVEVSLRDEGVFVSLFDADDLSWRNISSTTTEGPLQVTNDPSLLKNWVSAVGKVERGGLLVTHTLGDKLTGLRYAWGDVPQPPFLYNSASLPASPFLARCHAGECSLVQPGKVPLDDTALRPIVA